MMQIEMKNSGTVAPEFFVSLRLIDTNRVKRVFLDYQNKFSKNLYLRRVFLYQSHTHHLVYTMMLCHHHCHIRRTLVHHHYCVPTNQDWDMVLVS